MKFEKRHILIALLIIYVFALTFSTIGFVHASEIYDYVIPSETATLSGGYSYNLYLDDNTPLTMGYLKDNPDFTITISTSSGNTPIAAIRPNDTSCSLGNAQNAPVELNYTTNTYINLYYEKYGEEVWDYPIRVGNSDTSSIITISVVGYVNPDETEPTEPEETTPVVPDDGTDEGEDTAGLLDSLLNGIKSFFTELFAPIIDFIESLKEANEAGVGVFDFFGKLFEIIEGYTLTPVLEFFESIAKNDAITIVMQVWDFPIVKELLIAVVALLVFSGLIRLLTTL